MNIVFFVHCFFPNHFYGTETYTLELARHYQRWGHRVTVVSAVFQGEKQAAELITHYEYLGVPVVQIDKNVIPHRRVKETYYQGGVKETLIKVLKELAPDLVHVTHLINHTAVLLEATIQLGIPTYATFTDFFGFCLNNKLEAADGSLCKGPTPSRSNCVACYLKDAARNPASPAWMHGAQSPRRAIWIAQAASLLRHLPGLKGGAVDGLVEDVARRPNILAKLYNDGYRAAVAPTRFLKKAYVANGIRAPMHEISFGIDIDRRPKPKRPSGWVPVIGFIGQIAPHKGTDLLIEAFKRLPRSSAKLLIYGPDSQEPAYMARLKTLAEGNAIEFKGTFPTERMAKILRDLDLLAIPSRWYENSPLVLLNALATHTPVLITNVEGMTEFVTDGVQGVSFQLGSVDDLEMKLRAVLNHPETLHELSTTTHYDRTTETMALETQKIYSIE